jgi:carboxylesterase
MTTRFLFLILFLVGAFMFPSFTLIFASFILVLILIINLHGVIENQKLKVNRQINKDFQVDLGIGAYNITKPFYYYPGKRFRRGVLLIHGFSASTSEFKYLMEELKTLEIPFYAPTLTGFGLINSNLLKVVTPEDWKRDVVYAYDNLHALCDEIDVIGHSMGGLLAIHLAAVRQIRKLILTSPYLKEKENHSWYKKYLLSSFFSGLIKKIRPIVVKSSKKNEENSRFVYSVVPIESIESLWKLTDSLSNIKFSVKNLTLLLGAKDSTIELGWTSNYLAVKCENLDVTTFEDSGHNILEDIESDKVNLVIIKKLSD